MAPIPNGNRAHCEKGQGGWGKGNATATGTTEITETK